MPKRLFYSLGFSLGICLVMFQTALMPNGLAAGLLVFSLGGLLLGRNTFFVALILGWVWANIASAMIIESRPNSVYLNKPVEITGRVLGMPGRDALAARFDFLVQSWAVNGYFEKPNITIRLRWYGNAPKIEAGDQWRLWVKLRKPRGYRNRHGFDYEQYLFQKGVSSTGYVLGNPPSTHQRLSTRAEVDRSRSRFSDFLTAHEPPLLAKGVLAALAVGDRSGISRQRWEILRQSGLGHLVAISGLHVGLAATFGFIVIGRLWRLVGTLTGKIPARHAGLWGALLCALAYSVLSGFPVSTVRAFIMISLAAVLLFAMRRPRPENLLATAMLAVGITQPLSVFSPGFWLSFAAVWLIFRFVVDLHFTPSYWDKPGRCEAKTWFHSLLFYAQTLMRLQIVLLIGLAPLLFIWFGEISLVSPIVNFFAVPVFELIVVPLTLTGLIFYFSGFSPATTPFFWISDWIISKVLFLSEWFSEIPGAILSLDPIPGAIVATCFAVIVFSKCRVKKTVSVLLLILFGAASFGGTPRPAPGHVRLSLLDVGQGLAAVVYTANHVLLFDTGPRYGDFSLGEAVVLPELRGQNISFIDVVVVSHNSNDHAGGLAAIQRAFPIGRLNHSDPERASNGDCELQDPWIWDDVRFQFLKSRPDISRNINNRSCVLQVVGPYGSLLLTGDIERQAEQTLVSRYGDDLKVDILQVPHHGSKTSSGPTFLAATQPLIALFSRGSANRFGHPAPEIKRRYEQLGIRIFDTAERGQLNLETTEQGWSIKTFADTQIRFWHH
ncbi:DNA internalization-related competence protein ComEC/Rec2 [Gammaproteobacteria bacterium]|nr:DNA internalization-related competence protein ComEC/Rec2 [Gammaproteobacteria bacterium]